MITKINSNINDKIHESETSVQLQNLAKQKTETITIFPRIIYNKNTIELTMFVDVAERFLELRRLKLRTMKATRNFFTGNVIQCGYC